MIHESVFETMKMEYNGYRPKAQFRGEVQWNKPRLEMQRMIEKDPYTAVGHILGKLGSYSVTKRLNEGDMNVLHTFFSTGPYVFNFIYV